MFPALDRANLTVHSLDPTGLSTIGPIAPGQFRAGRSKCAVFDRAAPLTSSSVRALSRVLPDRNGGRAAINDAHARLRRARHPSRERFVLPDRVPPGRPWRKRQVPTRLPSRPTAEDSMFAPGTATPPASAPKGPASHVGPEPVAGPHQRVAEGASAEKPDAARLSTPPRLRRPDPAGGRDPGRWRRGPSRPAAEAGRSRCEVVAAAFDRGGRSKGVARQTIELSWPASAPSQARRFDVLSRLDLPPGEYEIRVGVSRRRAARTASVFTYVTVPPFDGAPLSLSNIIVGATAGTLTAPKDFLSTLLPIVPTTRREFARAEHAGGVPPHRPGNQPRRIRSSRCSCGRR